MSKKSAVWIVGAVFVLSTAQASYGSFVENATIGLNLAGFSTSLQRDIYQDGWDYRFSQLFSDKKYDFGNVELTLNGSLVSDFTIGRRGLDEATFSFTTSNPLSFSAIEFDGINRIVTDGAVSIDGNIKVNQLGFYDLEVNRLAGAATITSEGLIPGTNEFSFTNVPIHIRGHWLVDLVNVTLGDALGFTLPGGMTDIGDQVAGFMQQYASAKQLMNTSSDVYAPAGLTISAVPEPATILILLLGVPVLCRRRKK
jgi:hypothetical protein